jgi:transcriptional regulator with XRE-family HTH domain
VQPRSSVAKTHVPTDSALVIGRNLRRICKAKGISATDLAEMLGRSSRTTERILDGQRNLNLKEVALIARQLRVQVPQLLRGL